jgi:hypothetical protein
LTNDDSTASDAFNPWPGVQLANDDWAGYNKMTGVTATFPFGAFAREGDILQVPFIGAYQIRDAADPTTSRITDPNFWEMNAVTMDCSFVDDQARDVKILSDPELHGSHKCNDKRSGRLLGQLPRYVRNL